MPLRSRSSKAKAAAKQKAKQKELAEGGPVTGSTDGLNVQLKDDKRVIFAKLIDRDHLLTPEEALLAAHWIRQILAIFTGVLFGVLRLTGSSSLLTHVLISFTSPTTFISLFHKIDIDEISTVGSIQLEGFMPAFALFLLTWIITYTIRLPATG